ncbi:hypothetical protein V8C37DRAFT_386849 [Trichoderma ceciliae]
MCLEEIFVASDTASLRGCCCCCCSSCSGDIIHIITTITMSNQEEQMRQVREIQLQRQLEARRHAMPRFGRAIYSVL